jgi:ribosome-associated translation inhibitor RaiA
LKKSRFEGVSVSIEIRFVNFDRSEALETFVEKHVGALLRRYQKQVNGPHKLEVHFKLDAKAALGKLKNSEVLILYKYPGTAKEVVVKKQGADLRKALQEAVKALNTAVQKLTEKNESGRRTMGKTKRHVK